MAALDKADRDKKIVSADVKYIICPMCGLENDGTYRSHKHDCRLKKYNARVNLRDMILQGKI